MLQRPWRVHCAGLQRTPPVHGRGRPDGASVNKRSLSLSLSLSRAPFSAFIALFSFSRLSLSRAASPPPTLLPAPAVPAPHVSTLVHALPGAHGTFPPRGPENPGSGPGTRRHKVFLVFFSFFFLFLHFAHLLSVTHSEADMVVALMPTDGRALAVVVSLSTRLVFLAAVAEKKQSKE